MKKTLTVNISGMAFSIDDDAYEMLSSYLMDIDSRLRVNGEDSETIRDIEFRIMEIFQENERGVKAVVNILLVKHVISVIGSPSVFGERSSNDNSFNKKAKTTRLMRDPNNRVFGGVCGGLSAYFDIDVSAIRVILVILSILSISSLAIAYIVLWIILPEANTYEELEALRTKYWRR